MYEDKDHPLRSAGVGLTEDERFLILGTSEGTSGGEIWTWDTKDPSQTKFSLLIPGFATDPNVIDKWVINCWFKQMTVLQILKLY